MSGGSCHGLCLTTVYSDLHHGSLYPMTFSYLASRLVTPYDLIPCTIPTSCGGLLTDS